MGKVQGSTSSGSSSNGRPALSPEARQNQLIALAVDLVEQRLRDGSASSQETTHFLKLASEKSKLENAKLAKEVEMISAKTDSIRAEKERENLFKEAIDAMKRYSGHGDQGDHDDY